MQDRQNQVRASFIALLLAAFLSLLLLQGCPRAQNQGVEIVFWAFGVEGENVQKLMPDFEKLYPDIHVRVQMIPWNAAHEKLLTAYAGQSLPDACQLGNTWIPEFTILHALENLSLWTTRSSAIGDSSYFPGIWETNVIDSVLYGIPWYVDTRVLFYRADLFSRVGYMKPPRTWAEWFDVSKKLVQSKLTRYAIFLPTNNEWAPSVIMGLQMHSPLLKDRDTRGDFSGNEFRQAMETFQRFFTDGLAPVKTTQIINLYQAFAEGEFAMYISGPWNIGEFSRRLPEELKDAWMTAPLPGPDGTTGLSLAGGSSLIMFQNSKHKPEVWKLIEFLSEPAQQLRFYLLTGNLPARIESWRDSTLRANQYAAAFFTQLNHVTPTPKVPEWEQIAQKEREYSELIAMGSMNVSDAMAALDRDVNVMLEKRRWMIYGR